MSLLLKVHESWTVDIFDLREKLDSNPSFLLTEHTYTSPLYPLTDSLDFESLSEVGSSNDL